jgi:NAD(P)-dependent dehydrogenase (short-subunit alcohol dehydrogenase family)
VVAGDLTRTQDLGSLFENARQALGPISVLVNNASIFEADDAEKPDMALWDLHFAMHLKAPALQAATCSSGSAFLTQDLKLCTRKP